MKFDKGLLGAIVVIIFILLNVICAEIKHDIFGYVRAIFLISLFDVHFYFSRD